MDCLIEWLSIETIFWKFPICLEHVYPFELSILVMKSPDIKYVGAVIDASWDYLVT